MNATMLSYIFVNSLLVSNHISGNISGQYRAANMKQTSVFAAFFRTSVGAAGLRGLLLLREEKLLQLFLFDLVDAPP